MNVILAVALGGAVGAVARFGVTQLAFRLFGAGFPVGTLVVNVVGSFAMGVLAEWFVMRSVPVELRSFLTVGLLGALTTFSTFSLDFAYLIERGEHGMAFLYGALSVLLSLGALFAGFWLTRNVLA